MVLSAAPPHATPVAARAAGGTSPRPADARGDAPRTRVVFALDNLDVGGTEMNAVRLAERLHGRGYELSFACLRADGPLAGRLRASGIRIDVFPIGGLAGRRAMLEGLRFRSMIRRESVDVVHAHDRYTNVFATPWARLAGTPAVIASRRWGAEIGRAHAVANGVAYRLAHCVIANSPSVGAALERDGVRRERIAVVGNFLDEESFVTPPAEWLHGMRRRFGIAQGDQVVGMVANLRPVKDHGTLLHATAALRESLPRLRVVLVGTGGEEARLRQLAATLGVADRVHFAGAVPNLPNLHFLFDLSVLCSTSEGSPNTILEAMAAGRPVVATRVGGIPDSVVDDVTGVLVPPGDPARLAAAVSELLCSPERRQRMGVAGSARAREEFSADAALARLTGLYRRLAGVRAGVG